MAVELKSLGAWKRALEEGSFNEDGSKKRNPLSDVSHFSFNLIYALTLPSAKYQVRDLLPSHALSLFDIQDIIDSPMVHWSNSCDGRIFWHASCEIIIIFELVGILLTLL
jgi:hypothetical protein